METPQIVAAALLVIEVLYSLTVSMSEDGHVKKTPESLLFDALVWFANLDGANFDEIRVRSIK